MRTGDSRTSTIIQERIALDDEELRLRGELSRVAYNRKELQRRCNHTSALREEGAVKYCADCGYQS